MIKKLKIKKGQSLFETIFAIAIVSLVVVSLVALSTKSVSNSNAGKERSLARTYAQEGQDWLRYQRDLDGGFDNLLTYSGPLNSATFWCINDLNWTSGLCGNNTIGNTIFKRELYLEKNNALTEITAVVRVSWPSSGGETHIDSSIKLGDPRLF